jgi:predicted nucleic acid-binding protein
MPGTGSGIFVDTNVLLYSHDRRDAEKAERSRSWLRELAKRGVAIINLQVLNEFTDVLLRKRWLDSPDRVFSTTRDFARLGDSPLTQTEVKGARPLHLRYGYSWWDCLLLASALELGCTHFLSEDLQDGQVVEDGGGRRLTILSPFAHSPGQFFSSR